MKIIKGVTKTFTVQQMVNRLKKFFSGFLSFSNWVPDEWIASHRILGAIVNYGDNFLYALALGQNGIGFIFSLIFTIQQGGENNYFLQGF